MDVTDDLMAHETAHPLDGLADDSRPEMSHMEGLCHVGPAVIHNYGLRLFHLVKAQLFSCPHAVHVIGKEGAGKLQIDKARHHRRHFLEITALL